MWEIFVQYKDKQGNPIGRSECDASAPEESLQMILDAIRGNTGAFGAVIHVTRRSASQMDLDIDELSGLRGVL